MCACARGSAFALFAVHSLIFPAALFFVIDSTKKEGERTKGIRKDTAVKWTRCGDQNQETSSFLNHGSANEQLSRKREKENNSEKLSGIISYAIKAILEAAGDQSEPPAAHVSSLGKAVRNEGGCWFALNKQTRAFNLL